MSTEGVTTDQSRSTSELICLLYEKLKTIASIKLRSERIEHTLQATALVNETYLRLNKQKQNKKEWESVEAFVGAAADVMRRILINHARDRKAIKRGRDWCRVSLELIDPNAENSAERLLELNEAFEELEANDKETAEVARLRLFGGLTIAEIVSLTGMPSRTVDRRWAFARTWLKTSLD